MDIVNFVICEFPEVVKEKSLWGLVFQFFTVNGFLTDVQCMLEKLEFCYPKLTAKIMWNSLQQITKNFLVNLRLIFMNMAPWHDTYSYEYGSYDGRFCIKLKKFPFASRKKIFFKEMQRTLGKFIFVRSGKEFTVRVPWFLTILDLWCHQRSLESSNKHRRFDMIEIILYTEVK